MGMDFLLIKKAKKWKWTGWRTIYKEALFFHISILLFAYS